MNESREYHARCNKLDKDKCCMFSLVELKQTNKTREQVNTTDTGNKLVVTSWERSGEEQDRNNRLKCTNYYCIK